LSLALVGAHALDWNRDGLPAWRTFLLIEPVNNTVNNTLTSSRAQRIFDCRKQFLGTDRPPVRLQEVPPLEVLAIAD